MKKLGMVILSIVILVSIFAITVNSLVGPWSLIFGPASSNLFQVAGLAANPEEAASLAQQKLVGIGQQQLVAVAGPGAPDALQAATFFQNPAAAAQGLAIQEVQKQVLQTLASSNPGVGFMLQVYGKLGEVYSQGQVLFNQDAQGSAGHVRVDAEGHVEFEGVDFRGV